MNVAQHCSGYNRNIAQRTQGITVNVCLLNISERLVTEVTSRSVPQQLTRICKRQLYQGRRRFATRTLAAMWSAI